MLVQCGFQLYLFFGNCFCFLSSSRVLSTLGQQFRLTCPEVFLKHQKYVLAHTGKQYCAMLFITGCYVSFWITNHYIKRNQSALCLGMFYKSLCTCYITQVFIASDLLSRICEASPHVKLWPRALPVSVLGKCVIVLAGCIDWASVLHFGVAAQITLRPQAVTLTLILLVVTHSASLPTTCCQSPHSCA